MNEKQAMEFLTILVRVNEPSKEVEIKEVKNGTDSLQ